MTAVSALARRRKADKAAFTVALTVFFLSLAGLVVGLTPLVHPSAPSKQTVVTNVTSDSSTSVSTTKVSQTGTDAKESTTTKTDNTPKKTQQTKVTTTPSADNSFIGHIFQNMATVWILDLLLAVLAGVLAGAATQRVCLSHYGFKLGGLEVDAIPDVPHAAAQHLVDRITRPQARRVGNLAQGYVEARWWARRPEPLSNVRAAIIAERVALEAGARELAPAPVAMVTDFHQVIGGLVSQDTLDIDAAFGDQMIELIDLGNRVVAGAKFQSGADALLLTAFQKAIELLASKG